MKIVEFFEENGTSRSRNFLQAGAEDAQKWTGSATLVLTMQDLETYGAALSHFSGDAGAVKRCGSDSSFFELIINIKNMAPRVPRPHNFYAAPGSDFGLKF
jgi:hypothetical protein